MREEGSKTLVIIGTVLGALMGLACLGGTAFFFLGVRMSAPVSVTAPVSVPVPAAAAPPLQVLVLSDGGVIFGDAPMSDDDLAYELRKRFDSSGDTQQVVLAADERVPHARVVQLIDLAKQAGFTRIALGVSQK